jgi:hypothetical protein
MVLHTSASADLTAVSESTERYGVSPVRVERDGKSPPRIRVETARTRVRTRVSRMDRFIVCSFSPRPCERSSGQGPRPALPKPAAPPTDTSLDMVVTNLDDLLGVDESA